MPSVCVSDMVYTTGAMAQIRVSRLSMPKRLKRWHLADDEIQGGIRDAIKLPSDVAFLGQKHFIVADSNGHRLLIFDREGNMNRILANEQIWPSCVAVTRDGKIVVTDRKKTLIKVYDVNGQLIRAWAEKPPPLVEDFEYRPHGVAVNSKGQIFVSDMIKHNITAYSPDGKKLYEFGSLGSRAHQMHLPMYLCVDINDNIVVSDNMNNRVKVFDPEGNNLVTIGNARQFQCPYGVSVDPHQGNILVADHLSNTVSMFSPRGDLVADAVTKAEGCLNPCGVAVDTLGNFVFTEASPDHTNIKMYEMSYEVRHD